MKKLALLLVVMFSATLFVSTYAQDVKKETQVITVKAEKIDNTRGASPHIKTPKPVDDEVIVPKPKESEQARGEWCKVIVDNWTGYTIDIYVDGDYAGTVSAWGDGYTWAIQGKTKLYAESVGGTVYWGPSYVDCNGTYTWRLNP